MRRAAVLWLTDPQPGRAFGHVDLDFRGLGGPMRKPYESPTLIVYGHIADCTFTTPGGMKGCKTDCHVDKFTELSANTVS